MNKDNVAALAQLARIDISDTEAEHLSKEFGSILAYVGEVKKISENMSGESAAISMKNVMRGDEHPHESGMYTDAILKEAPETEGNYFKVKKIL